MAVFFQLLGSLITITCPRVLKVAIHDTSNYCHDDISKIQLSMFSRFSVISNSSKFRCSSIKNGE